MATRVYHIFAEVRPVRNKRLDPMLINGAFVRCLASATSADRALVKLTKQLNKDGLELVEVEWCVDFHNTDWESPGDEFEDKLANAAELTGDVQYGTFLTWGHDAHDAR